MPNAVATDCPRCGCNAVNSLGKFERLGNRVQKFQCDHCGHVFRVQLGPEGEEAGRAPGAANQEIGAPRAPGVVVYNSAKRAGATCPKCGAHPWKVTSTPGDILAGVRIRFHRCDQCGHTGKSQEAIEG